MHFPYPFGLFTGFVQDEARNSSIEPLARRVFILARPTQDDQLRDFTSVKSCSILKSGVGHQE